MDQRISGVALCLLMLLCLLPFSSLPFPPPPTYHGSKDFRCGLMSLDASVSAAILFPPLPSPPPRPIMNQRISGVALCLSMLLCLLPFSSLPFLPPPSPTYHGSKDFRCGLVSLDASVSAAILFPPLPFYESPFFYEER